jgi:hypothetical protein
MRSNHRNQPNQPPRPSTQRQVTIRAALRLVRKATRSGQVKVVEGVDRHLPNPVLLHDIPLCVLCDVKELHLVLQRKPLRSFPLKRWERFVLELGYRYFRWIYDRYGWAAAGRSPLGEWCNLETKGVYTDEAEAWHEANCEGGVVKRVPLNASLPSETCQYGAELWPALEGEVRRRYAHRQIPTVAIPISELARLGEAVEATVTRAEGHTSATPAGTVA